MENHKIPNNPNIKQRHSMLYEILESLNRSEDYENIIELMSPPKDIRMITSSNKCIDKKVGIIGGGLAGLSSAFELRKLGFDITIFDMDDKRVGGRVYTHYFDKEKRFYGELGAMRIPISHETTWHYIDKFRLNTKEFPQYDKNAYIYVKHNRARNDEDGESVKRKIYPLFNLFKWERELSWQELLEYGLESELIKLPKGIRKEILQIKKNYSKEIQYFDSLSVRDVLRKKGLSEGAIEMLASINPTLGSDYNSSYAETLQEEYSVEAYYRYEIIGGFSRLPSAFYNSLTSKKPKEYFKISIENLGNVTFKRGKIVTGMCKSISNDKVRIEYKDKIYNKKSFESFDFVICAIPLRSLRNLNLYPMFSNEKMQAIKEVNYSSSQKVLFMCNNRFWEKENIFKGSSNTDLPIATIWYPGDRYDLKKKSKFDKYGVLLASYNTNNNAISLGNLNEKEKFDSVKNQIEQVHGLKEGYLDNIVEDYKSLYWNKVQGILSAYCYFEPFQKTLFSYAMIKPEYGGRVYFAGEHTSPVHAWSQGALNSGMKAANSIAKYCENI